MSHFGLHNIDKKKGLILISGDGKRLTKLDEIITGTPSSVDR